MAVTNRVTLSEKGRAFAFILWGAHVEQWSRAAKQLAEGGGAIGRHLAGYPAKNLKVPLPKLRSTLPKAVEAQDVKRLNAIIPWAASRFKETVPFEDVVGVVRGVEVLTRVPESIELCERVMIVRTGGSPAAAPSSPVAKFAAEYEGPLKVEAAAEAFQLSIPEAAQHVRPSLPESHDELRHTLKLAIDRIGRLERENRGLRTLVHQYLPTDDLY
jgi:hypothetical protein